MADVYESTESAPTYKNGLMVLPRPPIVRLPLSFIYAGMGVALGILTGAMLGLAGVPGGTSSAFIGSAPASSTASTSQAASYQAVNYVQPAVHASSSTAVQPPVPVAPAHRVIRQERSTTLQIAPAMRTRAIPANHIRPSSPAETRPARPIAHPLVKPARLVLASAPEVISVPMDEGQMSIDGGAKPSLFYTEGDLTVADYDPAGKTIETSDGRTFSIGATVSVSSATPWQEYRSGVHYRCDQNGSCTLMRPGAIALNARLI